jgi:hypothetical protein
MLLNQEDPTRVPAVLPENREDSTSPVVEAVAGWDPAADDSDVIVACRSASGAWYLAGTTTSISTAQVARLTGHTAPTP